MLIKNKKQKQKQMSEQMTAIARLFDSHILFHFQEKLVILFCLQMFIPLTRKRNYVLPNKIMIFIQFLNELIYRIMKKKMNTIFGIYIKIRPKSGVKRTMRD